MNDRLTLARAKAEREAYIKPWLPLLTARLEDIEQAIADGHYQGRQLDDEMLRICKKIVKNHPRYYCR